MLPEMVDFIAKNCPELAGCIFNADGGYDSDLNCKKIFDAGMIPNIRQRNPAAGSDSKNHRLHCRMRLPKNRKRFGKILAIAWNIRVLNRFECAHEKGIKIPSYG